MAEEDQLANAVQVMLDLVRVDEALGARVEIGRVYILDLLDGCVYFNCTDTQ